jgi:AcrR family transcriptional regulator
VLNGALSVFLASGFHTATIAELERATGLTWDELRDRYSDKERLFFVAIEHRLNVQSAGAPDPGELEAVTDLLRRVSAAGSSAMLRAQHRDALWRLTRLAEAAAGR